MTCTAHRNDAELRDRGARGFVEKSRRGKQFGEARDGLRTEPQSQYSQGSHIDDVLGIKRTGIAECAAITSLDERLAGPKGQTLADESSSAPRRNLDAKWLDSPQPLPQGTQRHAKALSRCGARERRLAFHIRRIGHAHHPI